MKIDLSKYNVPELIENDGKLHIYDKLKGIYRVVSEDTQKEEYVRQKTIEFLHDELNITYEAIDIEESEAHYHDNNKRMDLLVSGLSDKKELLMVVECKAEDVPLTEDVYDQAKGYAKRLKIPIVMIINGKEMDLLKRFDDDHFEQIIKPPTYEELLNYPNIKTQPIPEYSYNRYSFKELFDENIHRKEMYKGFDEKNKSITGDTTKELIPYILNFRDCLLDTSHKIENLSIGKYKFVKDLGVFYRKIDNTGINFIDNYRSLSVEINNKIQIINLLVTTYPTASTTETVLMIALNNSEIQWIHFDKFVELEDNTMKFYDNGATSTRNKGPIKRSIIFDYVGENSNLKINEDKLVELGQINMSDLLYCDNLEFEEVIGNCIEYALLKQERREIYKKEHVPKSKNKKKGPVGVQKKHINKILKQLDLKKLDDDAMDYLIELINNWAYNISSDALKISKTHNHQTIKWADMIHAIQDD